jgi:hypothetical protein
MLIKLPQRKIDYNNLTIEREAKYILHIDDTSIEYCQKTITETLL